MKRFEEINGSKFERLSQAEMASVKGGQFCISCMKRTRKIRIGWKDSKEMADDGTPLTFPH
ncbi:MAG: hypothetical protein NC226_05945 [Bacteroides cellulosilyticus]|nr:hypothetical protein [Bacteroides cellulosilyticus]